MEEVDVVAAVRIGEEEMAKMKQADVLSTLQQRGTQLADRAAPVVSNIWNRTGDAASGLYGRLRSGDYSDLNWGGALGGAGLGILNQIMSGKKDKSWWDYVKGALGGGALGLGGMALLNSDARNQQSTIGNMLKGVGQYLPGIKRQIPENVEKIQQYLKSMRAPGMLGAAPQASPVGPQMADGPTQIQGPQIQPMMPQTTMSGTLTGPGNVQPGAAQGPIRPEPPLAVSSGGMLPPAR